MLKAHHISKTIRKKTIVRDVSLEIKPGKIVGLFGPNGAGKTTSFLMMTGLVRPDSGKIFLDGQDVTLWPLYRKARMGLRYLPQESSVFRGLNVEQNLMAALDLLVPNRQERETQLAFLLKEFHLDALRHHDTVSLSGGQRRRVEIARALAGSVRYLLLDEPLTGLDPKSILEVIRLIQNLSHRNIGILLTEHNVREMLPIVDYGYILYEGGVLFEGTSQEIRENQDVQKHYLGSLFE